MVKCYFRANVLEVFKTTVKVKMMLYFLVHFVFGREKYFAVARIDDVKLPELLPVQTFLLFLKTVLNTFIVR